MTEAMLDPAQVAIDDFLRLVAANIGGPETLRDALERFLREALEAYPHTLSRIANVLALGAGIAAGYASAMAQDETDQAAGLDAVEQLIRATIVT